MWPEILQIRIEIPKICWPEIHGTRLSIAEIPDTRPELLDIGPKTVGIL